MSPGKYTSTPPLEIDETANKNELSGLETDTTSNGDLEQKVAERNALDQIERKNSTAESIESIDSRNDESGEDWTKFLVVTACKWVMGIDLDVDVLEPKRWTKMASRSVKAVPTTKTAYVGTSIPQETLELLRRLGPGTIVTFS